MHVVTGAKLIFRLGSVERTSHELASTWGYVVLILCKREWNGKERDGTTEFQYGFYLCTDSRDLSDPSRDQVNFAMLL